MKRVSGYKNKETAQELAKKIKGKVRRNRIKLFGKYTNEWGVFK